MDMRCSSTLVFSTHGKAPPNIYKSKLKISVCDDKVVTLESVSTVGDTAYGDGGAGGVNARSKRTFVGSATGSSCTTPPRQITHRYDNRELNVDEDLAELNAINLEETIVAAQKRRDDTILDNTNADKPTFSGYDQTEDNEDSDHVEDTVIDPLSHPIKGDGAVSDCDIKTDHYD
ncbi:hypothetical protein BGZ79_006832 [Entomortierella chlamydospora]|nr:hypothetical protein BGZ79_006832 [Entomortierella chlamydospora]